MTRESWTSHKRWRSRAIVRFLQTHQYVVSLLNPAVLVSCRKTKTMRRKTDKVDAYLLALEKPRRTRAAIHRKVMRVAKEQGWPIPSYSQVSAIIDALDPGLVVLAHEGSKVLSKKREIQSTSKMLWISPKVSGNGTTLFTGNNFIYLLHQ